MARLALQHVGVVQEGDLSRAARSALKPAEEWQQHKATHTASVECDQMATRARAPVHVRSQARA